MHTASRQKEHMEMHAITFGLEDCTVLLTKSGANNGLPRLASHRRMFCSATLRSLSHAPGLKRLRVLAPVASGNTGLIVSSLTGKSIQVIFFLSARVYCYSNVTVSITAV